MIFNLLIPETGKDGGWAVERRWLAPSELQGLKPLPCVALGVDQRDRKGMDKGMEGRTIPASSLAHAGNPWTRSPFPSGPP
jgi:hypothetical protein